MAPATSPLKHNILARRHRDADGELSLRCFLAVRNAPRPVQNSVDLALLERRSTLRPRRVSIAREPGNYLPSRFFPPDLSSQARAAPDFKRVARSLSRRWDETCPNMC